MPIKPENRDRYPGDSREGGIMMLPTDGQLVLAWLTGDSVPVLAHFSDDEIVTGGEFSPPDAVWHDGEEWPDGDGELHALPGWWVHGHENIDGGAHEYYWLGRTDCVDAWVALPERPDADQA